MKIVINRNGFIEKLFFKNKNIIFPWGIEYGDEASFFSLVEGGWRNSRKIIDSKVKDKLVERRIQVEMSSGNFDLDYRDNILSKYNLIEREASLKAISSGNLMDFVVRYRFRKDFLNYALINGKKVFHNNTNKYHQYPVKEAFLVGNDFSIKVEIVDTLTAGKLSPFIYVRDFKNEWVVHCRLLPNIGAKEVVKLNTFWYNRALPQWMSDRLLRAKWFKKIIWYRQERSPFPRWNILFKYLLKPCGYKIAEMACGDEIKILTSMKIINSAKQ